MECSKTTIGGGIDAGIANKQDEDLSVLEVDGCARKAEADEAR
jgi:hypothetical protein